MFAFSALCRGGPGRDAYQTIEIEANSLFNVEFKQPFSCGDVKRTRVRLRQFEIMYTWVVSVCVVRAHFVCSLTSVHSYFVPNLQVRWDSYFMFALSSYHCLTRNCNITFFLIGGKCPGSHIHFHMNFCIFPSLWPTKRRNLDHFWLVVIFPLFRS